jgi:hypothetical protein
MRGPSVRSPNCTPCAPGSWIKSITTRSRVICASVMALWADSV